MADYAGEPGRTPYMLNREVCVCTSISTIPTSASGRLPRHGRAMINFTCVPVAQLDRAAAF